MDDTEIRLDDHGNYTYDICGAQRIKVTASAAYAVMDKYVPLFNELTGVKTNHKEGLKNLSNYYNCQFAYMKLSSSTFIKIGDTLNPTKIFEEIKSNYTEFLKLTCYSGSVCPEIISDSSQNISNTSQFNSKIDQKSSDASEVNSKLSYELNLKTQYTDEINLIAESIYKSLMFSTTLLEPYDPDYLGNSIIDADNDLDSKMVVSSKICVNMSCEAVLEPFLSKSSLNSKVFRALAYVKIRTIKVKNLFDYIDLKWPTVFIRLSSRTANYPGPIICEFKSAADAKLILSNSWKLMYSKSFYRVFLNPHLTWSQRIKNAKLKTKRTVDGTNLNNYSNQTISSSNMTSKLNLLSTVQTPKPSTEKDCKKILETIKISSVLQPKLSSETVKSKKVKDAKPVIDSTKISRITVSKLSDCYPKIAKILNSSIGPRSKWSSHMEDKLRP
ncbi:unnamed protein product [Brachionus calyciflorus]|uniref:Uncharacterized protein n=1 Tax=Brachionus calyciflorus TaxID=104777 RepID=A0A813SWV2_9BILA|nr:unnamed protein product [Brachionus calyciflorus]